MTTRQQIVVIAITLAVLFVFGQATLTLLAAGLS
jgi:hypothetical protein